MNDLTLLSDNELAKAVNSMTLRAEVLNTAVGVKVYCEKMLEVLYLIKSAGYKTEGDLAEMSLAWVELLKEQLITYGIDVVKEAVIEFIKNDRREYKQFPSVGQIIEICTKNGHNPKAELARRRAEAMADQMKAEYQAEIDAMPREYVEECVRKVRHLWGGCGE